MKQVVLIGDSIRMAYQDAVRREFAWVAEVWAPEENGEHTVNVLVHLHDWVARRRPDVLHVNAGLHDLKTITFTSRENVVPLELYRRNVGAILDAVREGPPATRIVWALTTLVDEERARAAHEAPGDFRRYSADVEAYNLAATRACVERHVPLNDLHAVARLLGLEGALTPDGVHFTPAVSERLGSAVAGVIRPLL